jgi:hypothetical protein
MSASSVHAVFLIIVSAFAAQAAVVGKYIHDVRTLPQELSPQPIPIDPPPQPETYPGTGNPASNPISDKDKGGHEPPPPPMPQPAGRVPRAVRDGDLVFLIIDTEGLRKDDAIFTNLKDQLKEFQETKVEPKLKRKLLDNHLYVTRRSANVPWDAMDAPMGGEAFGRTEFQEAFRLAFQDAAALVEQAREKDKVKVILLWCSDCNPDSLPTPLTVGKPESVLGLVWVDYREPSSKLNELFRNRVSRVSANQVGRLSDTLTYVLGDIWLQIP